MGRWLSEQTIDEVRADIQQLLQEGHVDKFTDQDCWRCYPEKCDPENQQYEPGIVQCVAKPTEEIEKLRNRRFLIMEYGRPLKALRPEEVTLKQDWETYVLGDSGAMYIKTFGKLFPVLFYSSSIDEVNNFLGNNENCGVLGETTNGVFFVCSNTESKLPSEPTRTLSAE